MEFKRYQSLKKFGGGDVYGIDVGECYIFPKIDGTNANCWLGEDGIVYAGSRNRLLDESSKGDNAGFCKWVRSQDNIKRFFEDNPSLRLYGEWLVPHSLKTYRDSAWRQFYVFDVYDDITDKPLHFKEYSALLEAYGIEYIPPISIINTPTEQQLLHIMKEQNTYLIEDGKGVGEGIVIKNYGYVNPYGNVVWAKMISNEFKDIHRKTMGANEIDIVSIEERIVDKFFTESLIEKEYNKILLILENKGETFTNKHIPMLLSLIYNEFLTEEITEIVKKFKNPTVNFRRLNGLCIAKIKNTLKEVF